MGSVTYSFKDVNAAIVGPGAAFALGNGTGAAEEGITITPTEDINNMLIGADGQGMHSLHADQSGMVTLRYLKNSPVNALLSAMFAFQTASSAAHGQNTININNERSGDSITCTQGACKKAPDLTYAKDGGIVEWEFHFIKIQRLLGNG
jgi:hypothetical protein